MQRRFLLGCLIAFSCFGTTLSAQTASNEANLTSSTTTLTPSSDDNWSFFHDEENHTYFIDFETINLNLSEIIVMNKVGEVVVKEDVIDLPVNSIYELDCSTFPKGEYTVELRSYTKFLSKKIAVK
jgi:hypothetical protein